MQVLSLIVVVLSISNLAWAAENRSTLWIFADEQIYSSNLGYQKCAQLAPLATNLVTTTYFTLTGLDYGIFTTPPGTAATLAGGQSATIFGLKTLTLTMIYSDAGSTANIQFSLATFQNPSALLTAIAPATYSSANGNAWFDIQQVGYSPNTAAAGAPGISWGSVMITDYRSNTTIVLTAWQDGVDDATNLYNHIYMVAVSAITNIQFNSFFFYSYMILFLKDSNQNEFVDREHRQASGWLHDPCQKATSGRESNLASWWLQLLHVGLVGRQLAGHCPRQRLLDCIDIEHLFEERRGCCRLQLELDASHR